MHTHITSCEEPRHPCPPFVVHFVQEVLPTDEYFSRHVPLQGAFPFVHHRVDLDTLMRATIAQKARHLLVDLQ